MHARLFAWARLTFVITVFVSRLRAGFFSLSPLVDPCVTALAEKVSCSCKQIYINATERRVCALLEILLSAILGELWQRRDRMYRSLLLFTFTHLLLGFISIGVGIAWLVLLFTNEDFRNDKLPRFTYLVTLPEIVCGFLVSLLYLLHCIGLCWVLSLGLCWVLCLGLCWVLCLG